jgi:hypothetical protein
MPGFRQQSLSFAPFFRNNQHLLSSLHRCAFYLSFENDCIVNFQHVCRQKRQDIKYNSPVRSAHQNRFLPSGKRLQRDAAEGWESRVHMSGFLKLVPPASICYEAWTKSPAILTVASTTVPIPSLSQTSNHRHWFCPPHNKDCWRSTAIYNSMHFL